MKIGISTGCFFPLKTHLALKQAGELGVKYVEIFFNTDSELEDEYVYLLKSIAEEYDMKVVAIHPFTSAIETFYFYSYHDYKIPDGIKLYEKYFKACNILKCENVVFHGCFASADYMTMKKYCEILNLLAQKASEYNVFVCQENVYKYKSGVLENFKYIKENSNSNVKFVFDIKQAVREKQNIYEMLEIIKDRLTHIHISDFDDKENSLLPTVGTFDFKTFFDNVSRNTTCQYMLIEVYNNNITNVNMLKNSLEFLSML